MKRTLGAAAVFAALVVLWVLNCSGPRASVGDVSLSTPDNPGAPYRVHATIQNEGRGHGEVEVTLRLVDRATERTYQGSRKVELGPGETTQLTAEILAPPGDYTPLVQVDYPAR